MTVQPTPTSASDNPPHAPDDRRPPNICWFFLLAVLAIGLALAGCILTNLKVDADAGLTWYEAVAPFMALAAVLGLVAASLRASAVREAKSAAVALVDFLLVLAIVLALAGLPFLMFAAYMEGDRSNSVGFLWSPMLTGALVALGSLKSVDGPGNDGPGFDGTTSKRIVKFVSGVCTVVSAGLLYHKLSNHGKYIRSAGVVVVDGGLDYIMVWLPLIISSALSSVSVLFLPNGHDSGFCGRLIALIITAALASNHVTLPLFLDGDIDHLYWSFLPVYVTCGLSLLAVPCALCVIGKEGMSNMTQSLSTGGVFGVLQVVGLGRDNSVQMPPSPTPVVPGTPSQGHV